MLFSSCWKFFLSLQNFRSIGCRNLSRIFQHSESTNKGSLNAEKNLDSSNYCFTQFSTSICLLFYFARVVQLLLIVKRRRSFPPFPSKHCENSFELEVKISSATFCNLSPRNNDRKRRRNSWEKLRSFIVLAIFRKTKVFNGKFIIYACFILFFHMNNYNECKNRETASNVGIFIPFLKKSSWKKCSLECCCTANFARTQ